MKYPKTFCVACDEELHKKVAEYSAKKQQSTGVTIRQAAIYYLESMQS